MARTHYIAGNWKMNTSKAEAVALAKDLVAQLKDKKNKFMIGVPFVYLDAVAQVVKGSNIILAAQDCAATENAATKSVNLMNSSTKRFARLLLQDLKLTFVSVNF